MFAVKKYIEKKKLLGYFFLKKLIIEACLTLVGEALAGFLAVCFLGFFPDLIGEGDRFEGDCFVGDASSFRDEDPRSCFLFGGGNGSSESESVTSTNSFFVTEIEVFKC